MIGSVLDKYEVLQKVGEGGMATVYRGRHTTLGRDVAIKILHPHLSASTRNRKRFAREARAIEHLKHPNILEIHDYSGTDADECYIVTEYVTGDTLAETMNRLGKMPSEPAAMIGHDLALALDFAHRNGVLHRDLKPDNVMIRDDGTVKLMDFGIARFLDESQVTMTGALVGSPAFMSPEQAREGDLDARSDLFSLGTLLFFLVTGHLPFAGNNPSVILKNIIEGNRTSVSELAPMMSASFADIIERLLASDRNDRFNTAAEVADALAACLAEVGVDRSVPGFSLLEYLVQPEPWVRRLEDHLRASLLQGGKVARDRGDQLAALRLWNRLLSIDEANEEVLALVAGLHTVSPASEPPRGRYAILAVALAALIALGTGGGALFYWAPTSARLTPADAPPAETSVSSSTPAAPVEVVPVEDPPETPIDPSPSEVSQPSLVKVPAMMRPPRSPLDPSRSLPLAVAPPVPVDGGPVAVTFKVANSEVFAEVWCDGKKVARTRGDNTALLTPGTWACTYKSPKIFDEAFAFEVDAGAPHEESHTVRLKPLLVRFDASCGDTCRVSIDGSGVGTVGALARSVEIGERPDERHRIEVTCGDHTFARDFDGMSGAVACTP